MPAIEVYNQQRNLVRHYVVPIEAKYMIADDEGIQRVKDHRKTYATEVNALHALNKQFQAEKNYAGCKELKEPIKHLTQAEKAATLVINWLEGKENDLRTHVWPVDLTPFLDYEFFTAYYVVE